MLKVEDEVVDVQLGEDDGFGGLCDCIVTESEPLRIAPDIRCILFSGFIKGHGSKKNILLGTQIIKIFFALVVGVNVFLHVYF